LENNRGDICVHLVSFLFALGILGTDISNEWVDARVYVFDIVFAHNFLVDDCGVLFLLGEV
jgi:hypothetical protein